MEYVNINHKLREKRYIYIPSDLQDDGDSLFEAIRWK